MTIDASTPFGQRVLRRLGADLIAWLTTVRPDGTPQPSPIWFLWDGATILIYSQRAKPKLRNIAPNPRVAVTLNSNETGGNIVILNGDASIDSATPLADQVPEYVAKYHDEIAGLGMTDAQFAAEYSVPIRVTPTNLRGH